MNPTDQASKFPKSRNCQQNFLTFWFLGKEARKKELKKNKKQRLMVRQAVLKNKDPSQLIEEMEAIDDMGKNFLSNKNIQSLIDGCNFRIQCASALTTE